VDGPTWAIAVERAGMLPWSPVYHITVSADVPFTSAVAVSKGGPATRWGGLELKKSLAAAIAEAAGSAVCARLVTAFVSAVCRLPAVRDGVAPIVNWLAPAGEAVVACKLIVWFDPSGKVRLNWMVSPFTGFDPRVTDIPGGAPLVPVTVAPLRFELMPESLKPNGEPATSSLIDTVAPAASGMRRRPRPLVPRSAWARSAITCLSPACAPVPLRMASVDATAGCFTALPENK